MNSLLPLPDSALELARLLSSANKISRFNNILFSRPLSFVAGPVSGRQTVAYALQESFRSIAGPIVKVSKRYYWFTNCLKLLSGLLDYRVPVQKWQISASAKAAAILQPPRNDVGICDRRSSAPLRIA